MGLAGAGAGLQVCGTGMGTTPLADNQRATASRMRGQCVPGARVTGARARVTLATMAAACWCRRCQAPVVAEMPFALGYGMLPQHTQWHHGVHEVFWRSIELSDYVLHIYPVARRRTLAFT